MTLTTREKRDLLRASLERSPCRTCGKTHFASTMRCPECGSSPHDRVLAQAWKDGREWT